MDSNVEGGSISQTDPTIGDPNFDLRNELLAGEDGFLLPLENDKEGGSSTSPWQPRFFCPSLPPLPPPPSPPTLPSQPLPPLLRRILQHTAILRSGRTRRFRACFTQRGVLLVALRRPARRDREPDRSGHHGRKGDCRFEEPQRGRAPPAGAHQRPSRQTPESPPEHHKSKSSSDSSPSPLHWLLIRSREMGRLLIRQRGTQEQKAYRGVVSARRRR
ncbi:hypothetical protein HPP92_016290 [Vanilla planifolia]|uniref:Uncharacterized protein n=1 Tax=Vanilla planifolia TaxID=51239 RepID=A0A835QFC9_VANPL|nr:hypothetical protein HPP92_016290 [Vanilla planifolia]